MKKITSEFKSMPINVKVQFLCKFWLKCFYTIIKIMGSSPIQFYVIIFLVMLLVFILSTGCDRYACDIHVTNILDYSRQA